MTNFIPIHNKEAEESILGCLLIDKDVVAYTLNTLTDEHFYDKNNRFVFQAIRLLASDNKNIDLISVKDKLEGLDIEFKGFKGITIDKFKKDNVLEEIGGISKLTELTEVVPTTANYKQYIEIIKEKYRLRKLQSLSDYISNNINNNLDSNSVMDLLEKGLKDINSLGTGGGANDMMTIMVEHYESLLDSLESGGGDIKRVKTGFTDIDKFIGAMHGGDLIVIAAASSIGKTLTALNIINNVTKEGGRGLLFTMEMNKNKITDILLTMNSDIKYHTLQTWNNNISELRSKLLLAEDRLSNGTDQDDKYINIIKKQIDLEIKNKQDIIYNNMSTIDSISQRELYIEDRGGITTQFIRNKIMELSIKDGLDLVVIDQLSLMKGEGKGIRERYDIITGEIKQMAMEYNVPIILVVQLLGKDIGRRPGHVPHNDDIKESFKIYEDADKVFLLNREVFWAQNDGIEIDEFTDQSLHVYITKNRGGSTGDIHLSCDITKQKLTNLTEVDKQKIDF